MSKKKQRSSRGSRRILPVAAVVLLASLAVGAFVLTRSRDASARVPSPQSQPADATFLPTATHQNPAPGAAPAGMVWIPGGEFSMGARDTRGLPEGGMQSMEDARPIHRVYVDGFWLDRTDVTNEEFAR